MAFQPPPRCAVLCLSCLRSLCAVLLCADAATATAGPIRDLLMERRTAAAQGDSLLEPPDAASSARLPAGVKRLGDIAYGPDPAQRMDVYLPSAASPAGPAPVVLMVHGGGWRRGDKAMQRVVDNKVARWLPRGVVFISVNYRMQAGVSPVQQADDVALALAVAQNKAAGWGADASGFILMGHSAGAHLVALLAAAPQRAVQAGAGPWLGTVALDSAAMDVPQIMNARHFGLYDRAFGADTAVWTAASPWHQVVAGGPPMLMVCSSKRNDSCAQAERLAQKAGALGRRVEVLPQALSHGEINETLGQPSAYTLAVEAFMASLGGAAGRAFRTP